MPYDPNRHQRRSIRLRGYDYTQPGYYFITICAHERAALFVDPALRQIAEEQWRALKDAGLRGAHAGRVSIDAWIVMPDHVHGIVVIGAGTAAGDNADDGDDGDDGGDGDVVPRGGTPEPHCGGNDRGLGVNVVPGSLAAIVRSYKAAVARRINRRRRTAGAPVWQRGYYERIVRDERELAAVRRYIATNRARHVAQLDALLRRMERKD
jgi:REP element-mobilizing transposase RayT